MYWKIEKHSDTYSLTTGRIRTNSAVADKSWLAELVGVGGKFGFERVFVSRKHDVTGNQDGEQTFGPLHERKLYEYRNIWTGDSAHSYRRSGGASGYFRLENAAELEMTKAEAIRYLQAQVAVLTSEATHKHEGDTVQASAEEPSA